MVKLREIQEDALKRHSRGVLMNNPLDVLVDIGFHSLKKMLHSPHDALRESEKISGIIFYCWSDSMSIALTREYLWSLRRRTVGTDAEKRKIYKEILDSIVYDQYEYLDDVSNNQENLTIKSIELKGFRNYQNIF